MAYKRKSNHTSSILNQSNDMVGSSSADQIPKTCPHSKRSCLQHISEDPTSQPTIEPRESSSSTSTSSEEWNKAPQQDPPRRGEVQILYEPIISRKS